MPDANGAAHVMPGDELDGGKKTELVTIKLQGELFRDLKTLADLRGRSYSKLIRALLHVELNLAKASGELPPC